MNKPLGYVQVKKQRMRSLCGRGLAKIEVRRKERAQEIENWFSKATRLQRFLAESKAEQLDHAKREFWLYEAMFTDLLRVAESEHVDDPLLVAIERMTIIEEWTA